MSENNKVMKEYTLGQDQELRFEVESNNEKVYLTLTSGYAEIFGSDLVIGETYEFTAGAKIAVFTWDWCVLQVEGETSVIYTSKETPMSIYSTCHLALESMRIEAKNENKRGPIAMIVGPRDVGKSTLSRLLLNYAGMMGRRPIFVDLDVEQSEISLPGTIGALVVERHAPVGGGFSQEDPLIYNFGHKSPQANITLFNILVNQLATVVKRRLEDEKKTKIGPSGVIINTCGWTSSDGYKQLVATAKAFEVEVIMVLDQEKLCNELDADLPSRIQIVPLPKSEGVAWRSKSLRAEANSQKIREYFYGTASCPSYASSFDVNFSDVEIYQIGIPPVPASLLPFGMEVDHMTKVVSLEPSARLLHQILAVSFAEKVEEVITANVAGFVYVTKVDARKQLLTLLSPLPEPLPTRSLVLSEIRFIDTLQE